MEIIVSANVRRACRYPEAGLEDGMNGFMRWLHDYTKDSESRRKGNLQVHDLERVGFILHSAHFLACFMNAGNKVP